ncbi:MAG: hypothetical protein IT553_03670 [Sphingomonadaceae bacterium]|nr:hypothetical protein [Sphingomonadaceae bacterium]
MDTMRRTGDGASDEAPGIEAPALIGQDERRMHVRAYNHWAMLLDGRCFPAIDALDLDNLGDFGPNSVLLDFTSGIDNPAIGFVGEALAYECELDENVQYIADVPRGSLLSRLTDHYLQIIANRAPIGFEAEFVNARGVTILYRGVLLPFSSDDDTIDFILGVINWKQAAEPALAEALNEEMAAAAAAAPSLRPTVPIWADGPDSPEDADTYMLDTPLHAMDEPTAYAASEDGDAAYELSSFDGTSASMADWLAEARARADMAEQAHVRGHRALYEAIAHAWGFGRAAAQEPEDYAELLAETGITASERAPMTPVVKLVFGAQYDKTRLAEYAAILSHAESENIAPDALADYLGKAEGGLKGLVKQIRAAKRADAPPPPDRMEGVRAKLRRAVPLANVDLPWVESDGEFVILVARRTSSGRHDVVALIDGEDKAQAATLRQAAKALPKTRG